MLPSRPRWAQKWHWGAHVAFHRTLDVDKLRKVAPRSTCTHAVSLFHWTMLLIQVHAIVLLWCRVQVHGSCSLYISQWNYFTVIIILLFLDFNEARGHDIERDNYLQHLRDGWGHLHLIASKNIPPPSPQWPSWAQNLSGLCLALYLYYRCPILSKSAPLGASGGAGLKSKR